MSFNRLFTIDKSPGEDTSYSIQIKDDAAPSLSIVGLDIKVKDEITHEDVTDSLVDESGTSYSGLTAVARFKNGEAGKSYKVTYNVYFNDGDHREVDGTLLVGDS